MMKRAAFAQAAVRVRAAASVKIQRCSAAAAEALPVSLYRAFTRSRCHISSPADMI